MKYSITVGRQYGSLGTEIGEIIAKHYFMPIYKQQDLIKETDGEHAESSMIKNQNVSANNSFIYSLAMDVYSMEYNDNSLQTMPTDHKKFIVQCNKIQELHSKNTSVFLGRASDYALSEYENVINIFFYADLEVRTSRISKMHNISEQEAKKKIIKIDKDRSRYYNYYTTKKWGDPSSYDLCLNTSKLNPEACAQIVIQFIDFLSH